MTRSMPAHSVTKPSLRGSILWQTRGLLSVALSRNALRRARCGLTGVVTGAAISISVLVQASTDMDTREQRIQHLEREAAQYRSSVKLLRANGADMDSAAVRALARELTDIRSELSLLRDGAFPATDTDSSSIASTRAEAPATANTKPPTESELRAPAPQSANSDIARLRQLLAMHQAEERAAEATTQTGSARAGSDDVEAPSTADKLTTSDSFDPGKIWLSGTEGLYAIARINERLMSGSERLTNRDIDLVSYVELRRGGQLLSSESYSLRALGQSQFVGRITLQAGDARIRVRRQSWKLEVQQAAAGEYLVTLYTPDEGDAQLHLIPVNGLQAASAGDLPTWLPDIGASAAVRS